MGPSTARNEPDRFNALCVVEKFLDIGMNKVKHIGASHADLDIRHMFNHRWPHRFNMKRGVQAQICWQEAGKLLLRKCQQHALTSVLILQFKDDRVCLMLGDHHVACRTKACNQTIEQPQNKLLQTGAIRPIFHHQLPGRLRYCGE